MSQQHPARRFAFNPWYLVALALVIILCIWISCKKKKEPTQKPGAKVEMMGWNLLFTPGTNKHSRDSIIRVISIHIKHFYDSINTANGTSFTLSEDVVFCPCDTLLYNYNFELDGAGGSVGTPPKPKGPAGSGDNVGAFVSDNIIISEPLKGIDASQFIKDSTVVKNNTIDTKKILAIIDSGLDTTFFTDNIANLIWRDPSASTMFNFLPGEQIKDFSDQTRARHGSAVAAIAIKAMGNISTYPKVMILKALDKDNKGSIFSVSCALSYAIQNKASLINLSLGYFGAADSIFKHYLRLCTKPGDTILVFAAAGNTPGGHTSPLCRENNSNLLTSPSRLFYPACFSQDFDNVISVTQISKEDSACYYQNYSNEFVSLGVLDKSNCCATKVDFLKNHIEYYEGSSFVTPAASGIRMTTLLEPGTQNWNNIVKANSRMRVTIEGKYIEYSSNE